SAAVGDFAVWDGLVRIPGTILEKRRARAIYRALTTQRIDPGLLQQGEEGGREPGGPGRKPSGGALFAVTVSPGAASATEPLALQFQQELPCVEGRGELRIALRPSEGEPPMAGRLEVRVRLEGTAAEPPAGALVLTKDGDDLVFAGDAVPLDRDLVVRYGPEDAAPPSAAAFPNPAGVP